MRTTTNTLSSAGERSLQGYSQLVRFSVPDSLLNQQSLPAQTVHIPLEYAQQRNRLEYLKGLQSFKRKQGEINDGPFMLNYLNRKRNIDKLRERILEEIEQKIAEDKYYVLDHNVREPPKRDGRSNSVLLPNRKRNVLEYDPIKQEAAEHDRLTSNQTRRKSTSHSNESQSRTIEETKRKLQPDELSNKNKTMHSSKHSKHSGQYADDSPQQSDDSRDGRNSKPQQQPLPESHSSKRSQLNKRNLESRQLQPIKQNEQQPASSKYSEKPEQPSKNSSDDEW